MTKKPRKTSLLIPGDLMIKARMKAIAQGTSVSAVLRAFLEEWIKDCPEDQRLQEEESQE